MAFSGRTELSAAEVAKILALRAEGHPIAKIARVTGRSATATWRAITMAAGGEAAERFYESRRRYHRARGLRRNFGITVADYDAMLAAQGGGCAICGGRCSSGKRLAVDHSHANGRTRGLLCANCNLSLGKMGDSPALLRKAASYLERAEVSA